VYVSLMFFCTAVFYSCNGECVVKGSRRHRVEWLL
jgi:hypothetical protein